MKLVLTAVLVAAALAAPATAGTALTGTVGPGFSISLKAGGTKLTQLKAGTYTINVSDKSSTHNFHLTGPGVDKSTSVGGTGMKTWKVTFKKGKYRYQCDPHAAFMHGSFTVT